MEDWMDWVDEICWENRIVVQHVESIIFVGDVDEETKVDCQA